ncbi:type VI secretion system baseplate subunit TssF [Flavisolibacter sp. BT320]|nr:type VI secretion system baseplate subunit TssF [Flavisolibacter longurius]
MFSDINNSKEVIKNRMLRYALNYWNIKNIEDLDPMVKLLLEALSSELYNLGNEAKDTQVRILEKVAGLLAPDFLTAPNPAHGILYASPLEPTEVLTPNLAFLTQTKVAKRQGEMGETSVELSFTPIDFVQVFDVRVSYMATGTNLFSLDPALTKLLMARGSRAKVTEPYAFWIGLHIDGKVSNINNLSFHFDWKNMEPALAQRMYQLLPLAKWFCNEKELQTSIGLPYVPSKEKVDTYQSVFLEYDTLHLMEKDIKQFYDPMFVCINHTESLRIHESKKNYPAAFNTVFAENDLQKLVQPLLWLKVVFPATLRPDFLNDLSVYTNAFPVVNRRLNDLKYRLKGGSNIAPLRTTSFEQFLSVKSLSDEVREYKQVPYHKTEEDIGTFTIRKGGVERFDERNARDLISYLLEMLRNESAAFAAFGYDFIATSLKEMNQKISLMEQKTRGYMNSGLEVPNYIIVKPHEGQDMMYVEYWTTTAELANGLRAGTQMQQGKGARVKQDPIVLLTSTLGGKNRLRPEERLNAFRYGITTRNRIITKEDIRNFCFFELNNRIQKVSIERGFEIAPGAKDAFRRVINVVLTPFEEDALESKEWQVLCEQLRSKLQNRSGMSNDYRVVLQHPV